MCSSGNDLGFKYQKPQGGHLCGLTWQTEPSNTTMQPPWRKCSSLALVSLFIKYVLMSIGYRAGRTQERRGRSCPWGASGLDGTQASLHSSASRLEGRGKGRCSTEETQPPRGGWAAPPRMPSRCLPGGWARL